MLSPCARLLLFLANLLTAFCTLLRSNGRTKKRLVSRLNLAISSVPWIKIVPKINNGSTREHLFALKSSTSKESPINWPWVSPRTSFPLSPPPMLWYQPSASMNALSSWMDVPNL
jgi:hypothetical protein